MTRKKRLPGRARSANPWCALTHVPSTTIPHLTLLLLLLLGSNANANSTNCDTCQLTTTVSPVTAGRLGVNASRTAATAMLPNVFEPESLEEDVKVSCGTTWHNAQTHTPLLSTHSRADVESHRGVTATMATTKGRANQGCPSQTTGSGPRNNEQTSSDANEPAERPAESQTARRRECLLQGAQCQLLLRRQRTFRLP